MIGVIDSGSGGVNVILECMKYYNEDYVFLVDNKNCPYGNKNPKLLKEILTNNVNYLTNNYDLDLIILACNTISALVDYKIMLENKVPILKTIPHIKEIKKNWKNILIFATKNTLNNNKEIKLLRLNYPQIKSLYIKDIPKDIDEYLSRESNKSLEKINKKLNKYLLLNKFKNINIVVLGCTHFKYIKNNIQQNIDNDIKFFDCEERVAKISKWLVRKNKKLNTIKIVLTQEDEDLQNTIIKRLGISDHECLNFCTKVK